MSGLGSFPGALDGRGAVEYPALVSHELMKASEGRDTPLV